jgi:hypothetical protein
VDCGEEQGEEGYFQEARSVWHEKSLAGLI